MGGVFTMFVSPKVSSLLISWGLLILLFGGLLVLFYKDLLRIEIGEKKKIMSVDKKVQSQTHYSWYSGAPRFNVLSDKSHGA